MRIGKRLAVCLLCLCMAAVSHAATIKGKISIQPKGSAAAADTAGPEITLTRPEVTRGLAVVAREESLMVEGRAVDPGGVASVEVNDRKAGLESDGRFVADILLKLGENQITVTATDVHRNSTTERFAVTREKDQSVKAAKAPPGPAAEGVKPPVAGRSLALLIGINAYLDDVGKLRTAVNDARAVAQVLKEQYGFETRLLLDREATRAGILKEVERYRKNLGSEDRFILYYAGHGYREPETETSYWLPIDAEKGSKTNWIMAKAVTDELKLTRSRHVLIVADSCYAGTMDRAFSPDADRGGARDLYLRRMQERASRVLIASGGNEPVTDSGGGGHSIFASVLLRGLRAPGKSVFTAQEFFSEHIREGVAGRSEQVPEYKTIRASGHDGGDFVFFRKR